MGTLPPVWIEDGDPLMMDLMVALVTLAFFLMLLLGALMLCVVAPWAGVPLFSYMMWRFLRGLLTRA